MTWPEDKMDYRDSAIVAFREPDRAGADLGEERLKSLAAKAAGGGRALSSPPRIDEHPAQHE